MNTKILVGSLRKESLNLFLARKARDIFKELGENDVEIVVPDLPLFNQDFEIKDKEPTLEKGRDLRNTLRCAERLLVCSPEYDRLPTAIILNACHWSSRPPQKPLEGTPVMLSGVSSGKGATKASRPTLRTAFERIGADVLTREILVPEGKELLESEARVESLKNQLRKDLPLLLEESK